MVARDPGKRKQAPRMTPPNSDAPTSIHEAQESDVKLDTDLQAHIGRQLRAVYDEVVNEPVPDKFIRLLEELERKQSDEA